MKYEEITKKIIGAAMKVHRSLGNGFQELIYQRALAEELRSQEIAFEREKDMDIYYNGRKIGTRRADFFIANTVMTEIKALAALDNSHLAQALNYLEAYNLEVGLLLNFGASSLQFKRIRNNKTKPK